MPMCVCSCLVQLLQLEYIFTALLLLPRFGGVILRSLLGLSRTWQRLQCCSSPQVKLRKINLTSLAGMHTPDLYATAHSMLGGQCTTRAEHTPPAKPNTAEASLVYIVGHGHEQTWTKAYILAACGVTNTTGAQRKQLPSLLVIQCWYMSTSTSGGT